MSALIVPPAMLDTCEDRLMVLAEIEQRVRWLATAIIDHANRVRPNPTGLKVGGHQASSASMTTLMTALWFEHLRSGDRVSVKPHASPVLHAINYRLGELDESYLTTLREFGGLQSYPSRSKDPDPVDYSTGSVGIGATAPIWGAVARRCVTTLGEQTASRAAVLLGRRCGTGRGRGLGSAHGPDGGRTGRGRVDRRPEPAEPGPGGAKHRRAAVAGQTPGSSARRVRRWSR
ncbi:pyruvate dehydrogenase E1 component [Saccharopolyspora shandongensis]|uniref:Pyruvate dehydrogenase E1 component n=1 Tax=Saccharopolyspora shandongensis TaxID=418495 RepID=A0A1H3U1V3_9PSEU|nr:pyruvate dehydrogenase E1 component [Saccharopolyspora shandongensis]